MSRQFPEALTAPIRYRTLSPSVRGRVNLRLSFSVLRHRRSTGSVVTTDPVSADADCDNGSATIPNTPLHRRHGGGTAHRLAAVAVGESVFVGWGQRAPPIPSPSPVL